MKLKLTLLCLLACTLLHAQNQDFQSTTYLPKGSLSLRSNVIPWLILMPNAGMEYKPSDRVGLIVDGGWMRWNMKMTDKYWRMWNVAPQIRYYVGASKNSYIGAQSTMGEYNFTGSQGVYMGGGLSLGHLFYAGKNLMVDLGLSLGYLHLSKKEDYKHIDGKNYRDSQRTSNGYWGPTNLSMTFVWKIN